LVIFVYRRKAATRPAAPRTPSTAIVATGAKPEEEELPVAADAAEDAAEAADWKRYPSIRGEDELSWLTDATLEAAPAAELAALPTAPVAEEAADPAASNEC
jgi:hypothetical protein